MSSENASKVVEEIERGAKVVIENYNDLNDVDIAAIARVVKGSKSLLILNLGGNLITDAGAVALSGAIEVSTTLTTLSLDNNQIGDVGAMALAEALSGNMNVTALYLWGNKAITDESVPALKQMLRSSYIKRMGYDPFHGTSISASAKRELRSLIAVRVEHRIIRSRSAGSSATVSTFAVTDSGDD